MTDCMIMGHRWVEGDVCASCGTFMPGDCHMETASGRFLDLANPKRASIILDDVAQGLSQTCRYQGQTSRFYSVAEHAYLVAQKLRAEGQPPIVQLAGLHHDDAEAFVGDNTRPMKRRMPGLREIEDQVFAVVVEALSLDGVPFGDHAIKDADNWALSAEAFQLLPSKGATWFSAGLYVPERDASFTWPFGWEPAFAKGMWLRRHRILRDQAGYDLGAAA